MVYISENHLFSSKAVHKVISKGESTMLISGPLAVVVAFMAVTAGFRVLEHASSRAGLGNPSLSSGRSPSRSPSQRSDLTLRTEMPKNRLSTERYSKTGSPIGALNKAQEYREEASLLSEYFQRPDIIKEWEYIKELYELEGNREPGSSGHTRVTINGESFPVNEVMAALSNFNPIKPLKQIEISSLVDFYALQRINGKIQVITVPNDVQEIVNIGLKKFQETKVIIHGYWNTYESKFPTGVGYEYASNLDYNVILVDWGKLTKNILYPCSRHYVQGVGKEIGKFLNNLHKASLIQPNNVHLIGHSLGAHAAGFAGKTVQEDGWKIRRITGLDPAGVLFDYSDKDRLVKEDADLVDVIHTCKNCLGMDRNIGHIDFYPNGGNGDQPGCKGWLAYEQVCSHGRAYHLYKESITDRKAFVGRFCEDENKISEWDCDSETTAVMGEWLDYTKEGVYYVKTADKSPFGLH